MPAPSCGLTRASLEMPPSSVILPPPPCHPPDFTRQNRNSRRWSGSFSPRTGSVKAPDFEQLSVARSGTAPARVMIVFILQRRLCNARVHHTVSEDGQLRSLTLLYTSFRVAALGLSWAVTYRCSGSQCSVAWEGLSHGGAVGSVRGPSREFSARYSCCWCRRKAL